MEIKRFVSDLLDTNMYVVEEQRRQIIIDPCVRDIEDGEIRKEAVDYIILTHEHYDHIKEANYWKEKTGATIIGSEACAKRAINPTKNFSRFIDVFCDIQTWIEVKEKPVAVDYVCEVDECFKEDTVINWQGIEIKLMITPGHTVGCICVQIGDVLFSGDSLMKDYPVACTGPGGSKTGWENISKPKLKALPPDILVYPGHFEGFKLSEYSHW